VKNPDAEEALSQWFSILTGRGVRVSSPMLKNKSDMGHNDFQATDVGCLDRNLGLG
jgi:hypothetical protein